MLILSYSFCESVIWKQLSWIVLARGSHEVVVKMWLGIQLFTALTGYILEDPFLQGSLTWPAQWLLVRGLLSA